jgi:hypothetical protein
MGLQMAKKYRLKMLIKINILASFLVCILFLFDSFTNADHWIMGLQMAKKYRLKMLIKINIFDIISSLYFILI